MAYYTPRKQGEVVLVKTTQTRPGYKLTVTGTGRTEGGHFYVAGTDEDGAEMQVAHRYVYKLEE